MIHRYGHQKLLQSSSGSKPSKIAWPQIELPLLENLKSQTKIFGASNAFWFPSEQTSTRWENKIRSHLVLLDSTLTARRSGGCFRGDLTRLLRSPSAFASCPTGIDWDVPQIRISWGRTSRTVCGASKAKLSQRGPKRLCTAVQHYRTNKKAELAHENGREINRKLRQTG